MVSKKDDKLLTEVELELISILWKLGEGSVHDVISGLAADRKLAYTSVSTILRILEQKKALTSRKEGRGHIYKPLLRKPDYEKQSLNHLVDRVFGGEPAQLVKRLLDTTRLSEEELKRITEILSERRSK